MEPSPIPRPPHSPGWLEPPVLGLDEKKPENLNLDIFNLYCMCVFCLHVYMGTTCVSVPLGGHNKMIDPLELELQTVVCLRVSARK